VNDHIGKGEEDGVVEEAKYRALKSKIRRKYSVKRRR